jgi:hypothetical protein
MVSSYLAYSLWLRLLSHLDLRALEFSHYKRGLQAGHHQGRCHKYGGD